MINKIIWRFLLKIQIFVSIIIYLLLSYRMWTKEYDPRFCRDSLIFNHISLFWFIHLALAGICLIGISYILLKKSDAKSVIAWELIIVFSVFIFLGIAEVYFRIRPEALPFQALADLGFTEKDEAMKDKVEYMYVDKYNEDKELGLIRKPKLSFEVKAPEFSYFVRTDSRGFFNTQDETLYDNADIVTVGDSFTEGSGVPIELSYPSQLAKILNARVLNLGHGSYDCYQYPIVLKRYGVQSHPNVVIMTVWDWNDLQLRYPPWKEYCKTHGYISVEEYFRHIEKSEARKDSIYIVAYFNYLKEQLKIIFDKYMALWNYGYYRGVYSNGRWFRGPVHSVIAYSGNYLQRCLKYFDEYISDAKKLSLEYHFRLIIVYIPSKELMYSYFMNLPPAEKTKGEMKKAVIAEVKKMGIELIDMTPIFVESLKDGVMPFYTLDAHLNKDGYKIMANTIADYLKNAQAQK